MNEEAVVESSEQTTEQVNTEPQFYEKFGGVEFKELFENKKITDEQSLGKWALNANSLLGKKGIIPPSEEATDEERAEFNNQINQLRGVPENGEYEFDIPEGIPDEVIDNESGQAFRDDLAGLAQEYGMSPEGFQKLIDLIYGAYGQEFAANQQVINELRGKLGENIKMDDAGRSNEQASLNRLKEEASELTKQVADAYGRGNHSDYKLLNQKRQEVYKRLADLQGS